MTHVTAVSGMHCAFLFGMVRLLVKNRRKAALVGIPLLFFFMLMVDAAPSVTRACIMIALLVCSPAAASGKRQRYNHECSPAADFAGNPYAAASIGLQLSFLSVAGILLFSNRIYGVLSGRCRAGAAKRQSAVWCLVWSALSTTVSASLFTLPLVAYYFDCVSLISPLTNLLCLWAVSFSFYVGFFRCWLDLYICRSRLFLRFRQRLRWTILWRWCGFLHKYRIMRSIPAMPIFPDGLFTFILCWPWCFWRKKTLFAHCSSGRGAIGEYA